MDFTTVILGAGEGTRMKSDLPKVLHPVAGYPMIRYVLDRAVELNSAKIVVVVGNRAELVREELKSYPCRFVIQKQQLGTGHAVKSAVSEIEQSEFTLVLYGDVPLIQADTINQFIESIEDYTASVIGMRLDDPSSYGRMVIQGNELIKIVEYRDADFQQRKINLVNTGIVFCRTAELIRSLELLSPQNDQQEYYLTDIIEILRSSNHKATYFEADDHHQFFGANDRSALAKLSKLVRDKKCEKLMKEGVSFISPENTVVDYQVSIESGSVIYPFCYLTGETRIGKNCVIGTGKFLKDQVVSDNQELS
ncbi:MAG: NTP transferase domain-containing protein [bacterium]